MKARRDTAAGGGSDAHAYSLRELGGALGVSAPAAQGIVRSPDWPYGIDPPWPIAEAIAWRRGRQSAAAPRSAAGRDVNELLKIEQTLITRRRRELLEAKYVSRAQFNDALAAVYQECVLCLDELVARFPATFAGRDLHPGEIEAECNAWVSRSRHRLWSAAQLEMAAAEVADALAAGGPPPEAPMPEYAPPAPPKRKRSGSRRGRPRKK